MLQDVLDVAIGGLLGHLDRASPDEGRLEQGLDRLLVGVGELVPLGVEELDSVVLGRVVRGGEDDAEILREQGDGRCRQDATDDGCPPAETIPRTTASSRSGPEPRVSRPTKTRPRPDHPVAARPSRSTSSRVSVSPTIPRTPSVPK